MQESYNDFNNSNDNGAGVNDNNDDDDNTHGDDVDDNDDDDNDDNGSYDDDRADYYCNASVASDNFDNSDAISIIILLVQFGLVPRDQHQTTASGGRQMTRRPTSRPVGGGLSTRRSPIPLVIAAWRWGGH